MRAAAAKLSGACGAGCGAAAQGVLGVSAAWAAVPLRQRLQVIRGARQRMAAQAAAFAEAISPQLARTRADTLVTELLPLLEACRFLEREAATWLAPRRLGRRGRPLWLGGVGAEVHREPLGHVLVIGPANFPLFLPGVQVMQALAAGNRVTWKPGAGGAAVAALTAQALGEAGLPAGTLRVTDESVEAAQQALAVGADKVVFTGSGESGRSVLKTLAGSATPAVVELSGADAVVVMPCARLERVAQAVAFGLRLNGGQVCMSPRRLLATPATMALLRPLLLAELAKVAPVEVEERTAERMRGLLDAAESAGATLLGEWTPEAQRPLLVDRATAEMAITRSDVFAPVLSLMEVQSLLEVPETLAQAAMGLTVAIFSDPRSERAARSLARAVKAGTVLLNDLIAPTADPRVPFGGRGASGYGTTRGAEGLLEMTAVKTLLVQRRTGRMRHWEPTGEADAMMLAEAMGLLHGRGPATRWRSLVRLVSVFRDRA